MGTLAKRLLEVSNVVQDSLLAQGYTPIGELNDQAPDERTQEAFTVISDDGEERDIYITLEEVN